jgi:hypothetical protein
MSLLMSNMIVPFLFLSEHQEAWVVLGTAFVTGAAFIVLTAFSGFSRLLGFGHLPWVPMLVYLIVRFPEAQQSYPETWFILWLQAVIVLDIGSLILDTANVVRYFRGEHSEMVEGLS